MVVQLTKDNFEKEVMQETKPVLIDFWAAWCGPCRMQSPIVDQVAEELGDAVKVCKLNVDEVPSVTQDFQIVSIPTLVFMKDGNINSRMIGLQDADTIRNMLQSMLDA